MKQRIIYLIISVLFAMAFPFHSSGSEKEIDFNFPQDVSKTALADLDKALKSGDGELTVDALVRYSIAQSSISQENMADIIERIEKVITKEKRPHIKSLLYYFEALVYQGYRDRYAHWSDLDIPVADISEWDRKQFDMKIEELLKKSLANPEALKTVTVTSLPNIIKCNELGATYVPTLFEFISMKAHEMISDDFYGDKDLITGIDHDWLAATEGNVPAHIYALKQTRLRIPIETYRQYQDNEHCALLLPSLSISTEEYYAENKNYLARFPNSIYATEVKNKITEMETKIVTPSYPTLRSSRDSIEVMSDVSNVNAFTLKVYRVPGDFYDGNYNRIDPKKLKLVSETPVNVQGQVPFVVNDVKTMLAPLPYGRYVIIPQMDKGTSQQNIYNHHVLHVTDMALFSVSHSADKVQIGAVDINTGKPLPDVTIRSINKNSVVNHGTTGSDGLLRIEKNKQNKNDIIYSEFYAAKGEDSFGSECNAAFVTYETEIDQYACNIYTDLGVYRPGETIHWTAVIQHIADKKSSPVSGKKIWVGFEDFNDEQIDSLVVTTDEFGRIEGSFTVPQDRMNGLFFIRLESRFDEDEDELGVESVRVSEYKTPTFEVTFPDARHNYVAGQPVKVTGKAMTYSGMPVQNTEVRLSLIQNEWSWWWRPVTDYDGEHLMDTTVVTDEQGNFTIEFAPELFEENEDYKPGKRCWALNNYGVIAKVTTDAGETQEESTAFIVGTRRGIELGRENDDIYLNDKPIKLPLKYNTTDEEHPNTYCTWEVTPVDGKTPVLTGNLNTADPTIDLTSLPSGQYELKIHILDAEEDEEEDVDVESTITLYRKGDKSAPVKDCPLWLTPLEQTVDKKNVGHVTIGVSTPEAHIYYVANAIDGVIGEGWLHYKKGMHDFTIPLPKEAGKDVTIKFITIYNKQKWSKQVKLANPYLAEAVKISATSFRNKLVPGDTEHWTFTLTDQNGKPLRGAMILDMYDKAIASIMGNKWYGCYRGPYSRYDVYIHSMEKMNRNTSTIAHWSGEQLDIPEEAYAQVPELYIYDQDIFGYSYSIQNHIYGNRVYGATSAKAYEDEVGFEGRVYGIQAEWAEQEEVLLDMSAEDMSYDELVVTAYSEKCDTIVNKKNLDKVVLRENDVKTALWQPMLTSDDKGVINLEFEVPNFNTTWITQAVAWDKKMASGTWMAEVLTQKPLMVRANMPRFLRQGDKAQLAAMVQNATDEAAACDAVIELFDPRTNDVYATRKFNLSLEPKGSQAVNIDWQVPDTIAFVGFRIKAANGRYGDGEQVMVPVLTTISPVIETEPFYVEAGQGHFEQPLPDFPADARVTLEYCDNPVWYCALALPTIFSDEYHVATHAAHSLFALQVAQGVAKDQPQIKEAVTYWKEHNEDSTLVSMLQKNQDLKIGTLLASPWMRDADRQTLRISKLNELFDEALMAEEYEKIISALKDLQMGDGGFTWFRYPQCESSFWTTGTVLEMLGEIKHLGYLPDDKRLADMTERALKYYDKESVRLYNEAKQYSKEPEGQFTEYAYVRSLFPEVKQDKASADLMKKTLKHMDKNWNKGITLKEKAYYAMTLYRNGYQKTAANIIESIRQFAIVKPSLGMYWDNLQTGYGWWEYDKVAYTSTILQAMSEVDPRQDEIDQVRKWMLLMKQSNDWGSYSLAADAVYSILSTGSQWLDRGETPSITVAGQPVNLDKMAQWLGYFRTTLDATTTGSVVIDRSAKGPAWGAVYSQFKAPMTEVKEKAIEEVSISKEYYVYAQDGTLHQASSFSVGDKVKVSVIIKVNKDMDYVTMTDERAACFEPVDQLSGYRSEDRTWFYLETKDSQTNAFFNSLDKGTHIIGYDVWVTNTGEFTSGIATIQCQYAPQLSAHSDGKTITVKEK